MIGYIDFLGEIGGLDERGGAYPLGLKWESLFIR